MKSTSPSIVGALLGASVVSSKPLARRAGNVSSTSPASSTLSIEVPASYDSPYTVDPNFLAFGFEEASFVNYILDADGNTNEFSTNLIEAVTSRTGGKPIIRLGGTSADYATYVANQTAPALPLAIENTDMDVGGTTIGPSFWALASRWPDAEYMVQVPLATTDINETILWVQTALDIIGPDQIHSIEVGNEPDWYSAAYAGSEGILGPPRWQGAFTNETYVGNYTKYVEAIAASVDLPTRRIFQAFDTAAHVADYSAVLCYELDVGTCMDLGLDDGGYVKTVAHHYYQSAAGAATDELPTGGGLMNMTFTHWRADFFRCQLDWLHAHRPDLPFVLSEVGNSLAGADAAAPAAYQAVLGSALWQVDFSLYAMALGVARVHAQQLLARAYQPLLWLPVEYLGAAPHVTANFYSQPLVADFIGRAPAAATAAARLDVAPARDNVAAYAAFEAGAPRRVAVVNLDYWDGAAASSAGAGAGRERGSVSVELSVPDGVSAATVRHLSSPLGAGADATTVTYGGSQWTYESAGKEVTGVRDDTEELTVTDGIVTITVNSSSAVLVFLS